MRQAITWEKETFELSKYFQSVILVYDVIKLWCIKFSVYITKVKDFDLFLITSFLLDYEFGSHNKYWFQNIYTLDNSICWS